MPAGRPKAFNTPEEMQILIDKYFVDCEGQVLKDKADKPVLNKFGEPVIINAQPLTVTGLALALGFNSRQSLLNYQDNIDFMDTITRAKLKIQQYAEKRLYDRDGAKGAQFSLQNNFGWKNESSVDVGNKDNQPFEVTNLTDEELKARIKELAQKVD